MCGVTLSVRFSFSRWMFWPIEPGRPVEPVAPVEPPAGRPKPPNDRPALYGMLLPTENSAFSLSIAMMCGADRMFVLSWFASAWNSTAYDGMLVPRKVCELVSGAPIRPPIRPVALISDDRFSDLRLGVWTPPR